MKIIKIVLYKNIKWLFCLLSRVKMNKNCKTKIEGIKLGVSFMNLVMQMSKLLIRWMDNFLCG